MGQLFRAFIHFYARTFDFDEEVVSAWTGARVPRQGTHARLGEACGFAMGGDLSSMARSVVRLGNLRLSLPSFLTSWARPTGCQSGDVERARQESSPLVEPSFAGPLDHPPRKGRLFRTRPSSEGRLGPTRPRSPDHPCVRIPQARPNTHEERHILARTSPLGFPLHHRTLLLPRCQLPRFAPWARWCFRSNSAQRLIGRSPRSTLSSGRWPLEVACWMARLVLRR